MKLIVKHRKRNNPRIGNMVLDRIYILPKKSVVGKRTYTGQRMCFLRTERMYPLDAKLFLHIIGDDGVIEVVPVSGDDLDREVILIVPGDEISIQAYA